MALLRPDRIFISVDQSTGRSTLSFAPATVGAPIVHEGDHKGEHAMREAKTISQNNPGCSIHGPHFHTAPPPGKKRMARRPSQHKGDE
ncbi:MAG: hypothetical protein QM831_27125 [Kofleriaceae bacterium]